jgi:hypothetical protein
MTECKHRWHQVNYGISHRPPNSYWYECQRCHKIITTLLKEKQNGN